MKTLTRLTLAPLVALLLAACGGSGKDVKAPDENAASDGSDATAADAAKAEAKPASAPPKDESASTEPPIRDIVCSQETAFVLDFASSDIGVQTEEKCRKSAGEDNKKFADCRRKTQDKLGMPVVKFEEKDGAWWWLTYDRRGSELVMLHKVAFTFAEETKDSLTIKPEGKDMGRKPGPVPAELVIKVPDANTIEIQDPKLGKMVYRAKIGIVEQPKPIK